MIAPGNTAPIAVPSLGATRIEEGRGVAAAGARLVLAARCRIARNEAAEMAGDDARIDVVAAADVAADDEIDGLAGVEIRGRRGRCHEAW